MEREKKRGHLADAAASAGAGRERKRLETDLKGKLTVISWCRSRGDPRGLGHGRRHGAQHLLRECEGVPGAAGGVGRAAIIATSPLRARNGGFKTEAQVPGSLIISARRSGRTHEFSLSTLCQ